MSCLFFKIRRQPLGDEPFAQSGATVRIWSAASHHVEKLMRDDRRKSNPTFPIAPAWMMRIEDDAYEMRATSVSNQAEEWPYLASLDENPDLDIIDGKMSPRNSDSALEYSANATDVLTREMRICTTGIEFYSHLFVAPLNSGAQRTS
jgi:hypothetical protein